MPQLPQVWNNSVAQVSLAPPIAPEHYEEMWWYSGSTTGLGGSNTGATAAGNWFTQKASNLSTNSTTGSQVKLYTLNANWSATTKFAFEAAIYSNNASYTAYAEVYDVTASSSVASSQISTTSTTATVIRSGQFTLTPGHSYCMTIWTSNSSGSVFLTDASLIIFS